MIPPIRDTYIRQIHGQKVKYGLLGAGGRREGVLFNGYNVFIGIEKIRYIDGGDDSTTLGMYLVPLTRKPTNG